MFTKAGWLREHWEASPQTTWFVLLAPATNFSDYQEDLVEVQASCHDHAVLAALETRNVPSAWTVLDLVEDA